MDHGQPQESTRRLAIPIENMQSPRGILDQLKVVRTLVPRCEVPNPFQEERIS